MNDSQMADRPKLEMRWVPVSDERGTTRMQAVWIDAGATAAHTAQHVAHHAA